MREYFLSAAAVIALMASGAAAHDQPIALIDGLGDHHHTIAPPEKEAQRYFDQGLVLTFSFNHAEAFAQLSRIAIPTTLFWGERDNFSTYEQQLELVSEIDGAELRVYAGAGHSLHWEEPRRFAADLANFVRALEWTRAVRHPLKGRMTA